MKRLVLCICLLPAISFARQTPEHFQKVFNQAKQPVSVLRTTSATLDSTYTYQGEDEVLTTISYYAYDESGRQIKEESKSYNYLDGSMALSSKTEFIYPEKAGDGSYETEERNFVYHDGEWVLVLKTINQYNASAVQTAMQSFRQENGEWVKDWVWSTSEYDDKGFPKVVMDSTFHADGSLEIYKMEAVYDDNNRVKEGVNYYWDEDAKEWITVQNALLSYNDQGLVTSQYTEYLEEGEWIFGFEYTYQYDDRGNMIREEDKENDGFFTHTRFQNFYSDNIVTHNEAIRLNKDFKIAVNSDSRTLTFDLGDIAEGTISLINTSGAIVRHETVRNSQQSISLNTLASGFYIVRLSTSQGEQSFKVVVR